MKSDNPYHEGEVVNIRAWWWPDKRVVKCTIIIASDPSIFKNCRPDYKAKCYCTVNPEGYGQHQRFVDMDECAVDPRSWTETEKR